MHAYRGLTQMCPVPRDWPEYLMGCCPKPGLCCLPWALHVYATPVMWHMAPLRPILVFCGECEMLREPSAVNCQLSSGFASLEILHDEGRTSRKHCRASYNSSPQLRAALPKPSST